MDEDERRRAGAAIRDRIEDLGLTPTGVADAAQIDRKTLRALIAGKRMPRTATRGRLEAALDWPVGEIYRRGRDGVMALRGYSDRELLSELIHRARRRDGAATS